MFTTLVVEPPGTPSSESQTIDIPPFLVKMGETLDLSAYIGVFQKAEIQSPVLSSSFTEIHP